MPRLQQSAKLRELPQGTETQVGRVCKRILLRNLQSLNTQQPRFMHNTGDGPVWFREGEFVVQLVVEPLAGAELVGVDSFDDVERGDSGFGSTGSGLN